MLPNTSLKINTLYPTFIPKSVLDFGSGPGTALWSAREVWPSIKTHFIVEPSDYMIKLNETITNGFPNVSRSLYLDGVQGIHDLVLASYVLSELGDDSSRKSAVRSLWDSVGDGGILVIVEPGTPIGFKVVRNARSLLIDSPSFSKGAPPKILAPCTHHRRCPQPSWSWCHFSHRVERIKVLQESKRHSNATQSWENEKFSYIVLSKGDPKGARVPSATSLARITRQPLKRKGHIYLDACTSHGMLQRSIISKSVNTGLFKAARKTRWGDLFNFQTVKEYESEKSLRPKKIPIGEYKKQQKLTRKPGTVFTEVKQHDEFIPPSTSS